MSDEIADKGGLVERDTRTILFEDVYSQLHRLHRHWRLYVTFFGSRAAAAVVQRDGWRFTFGSFQDLLLDGIVLNLWNLLGDVRAAGTHQASIAQLLEHLPPEAEMLRTSSTQRLTALRTLCSAFKMRRDKVIAHRDRAIVLAEASVDPMSILAFRQAVTEMSAILTEISEAYYSEPWPCPFHPDTEAEPFDADILLEKLRTLPHDHGGAGSVPARGVRDR